MKNIPLTRGKHAIISDADYPKVSKYKWQYHWAGYCSSGSKGMNNVFMHRFILGLKKGDGKKVDHINGNGLDNRRSNLRVCTHAQNLWNGKTRNRKHNTKYHGISFDVSRGTWWAQIRTPNERHSLTGFKTDREAAIAYNKLSSKYHGEFGRRNKITIANT